MICAQSQFEIRNSLMRFGVLCCSRHFALPSLPGTDTVMADDPDGILPMRRINCRGTD